MFKKIRIAMVAIAVSVVAYVSEKASAVMSMTSHAPEIKPMALRQPVAKVFASTGFKTRIGVLLAKRNHFTRDDGIGYADGVGLGFIAGFG